MTRSIPNCRSRSRCGFWARQRRLIKDLESFRPLGSRRDNLGRPGCGRGADGRRRRGAGPSCRSRLGRDRLATTCRGRSDQERSRVMQPRRHLSAPPWLPTNSRRRPTKASPCPLEWPALDVLPVMIQYQPATKPPPPRSQRNPVPPGKCVFRGTSLGQGGRTAVSGRNSLVFGFLPFIVITVA
jgi:hypothetical protein